MPSPSIQYLPSPPLQRYDAEIRSHRSLDGNGFRVELETQDVTGHRDFDVQIPEHAVTLTPDGPPTRVSGHIDGRPIDPFLVRPGQLTLRPAGQRFRGHTDGLGTRSEVRLLFEPEFVRRASDAEIDPSRVELVRCMDLRNSSILQALGTLGREIENPGPMGRAYTESLVVLTVTELVRNHSTLAARPGRTAGLPAHRVRKVVDYIEAHLGEDLSLLTLAAEAGMSPARFAREFKQTLGTSVHQYLLGRRVEWAAALLAGTELSVAEIALVTGFSSQAHLTTAFQRVNGTTPAAYRRDRRR